MNCAFPGPTATRCCSCWLTEVDVALIRRSTNWLFTLHDNTVIRQWFKLSSPYLAVRQILCNWKLFRHETWLNGKIQDGGPEVCCVLRELVHYQFCLIHRVAYWMFDRYGTQSDMWASGCVLYELCTQDRPFKGSTLGELVVRILHGKYAPISK